VFFLLNKHKWNLIIGISSGVILFFYILYKGQWGALLTQFSNINKYWLMLGFAAMLSYWASEAKILQKITHSLHGEYKFSDAFEVTMVGQFFNAITPFASGGQPAQLFMLSKQNVDAGKSGSILMIKFIIYQSVLIFYALILIIWKLSFFNARMSNLFYLIFLGFAVDSAVIIMLIILSKYRNINEKISGFVLNILSRFNIIKDKEIVENKINHFLDQFHLNIQILLKNKILILKTVLLTIIRLTSLYMIPYFIYRSFGLLGAGLSNMIAANAFVKMFISFIPIPGASGGAESSFYLFFNIFFVKKYLLVAILLWRLFTYYSGLVIGWLFLIFGNRNHKGLLLRGYQN